jgi:acyl carrier protein
MTAKAIEQVVLQTLGEIAPEADLAHVDRRRNLREQLDLDSMDFLNFVVGLHERLGIDIPEADYPKLATLEGIIGYFAGQKGRA